MKTNLRIRLYLLILIFLFLRGFVAAQKLSVPVPLSKDEFSVHLLQLFNYPFRNENDILEVNKQAKRLLDSVNLDSDSVPKNMYRNYARGLLRELNEFTAIETDYKSTVELISFDKSDDKAVRKLRDVIGLRPPAGCAIVRIYDSKNEMPPGIRDLFGENVLGVTRWCRYIAVVKQGQSEYQISDTISHELVHAYISSSLGTGSDKLPKWFQEGVALYLSSAQDNYYSYVGMGSTRISFSTDEYKKYKLIFSFLEASYGREKVYVFIRDSVNGASVKQPLKSIAGVDNVDSLITRAEKWDREKKSWSYSRIVLAIFIASVLSSLLIYALKKKKYRSNLDGLQKAETEQDESEKKLALCLIEIKSAEGFIQKYNINRMIKKYRIKKALAVVKQAEILYHLGEKERAEEKIADALHLNENAVIVLDAVQRLQNEMKGWRV